MKLQHGQIMEVANHTRAAGVFTALGSTWHELALDNEMPRYVDYSREVTIALDDPQATRVREHILAQQKLARQQSRAQRSTQAHEIDPAPEDYEPSPYDGTYSEE